MIKEIYDLLSSFDFPSRPITELGKQKIALDQIAASVDNALDDRSAALQQAWRSYLSSPSFKRLDSADAVVREIEFLTILMNEDSEAMTMFNLLLRVARNQAAHSVVPDSSKPLSERIMHALLPSHCYSLVYFPSLEAMRSKRVEELVLQGKPVTGSLVSFLDRLQLGAEALFYSLVEPVTHLFRWFYR